MKTGYSKYVSQLRTICKIAFDKNLIDTHSGNISMGVENKILITKTGRSLINLKQDDFTLASLEDNDKNNNEASSELEVHRFILKSFPSAAVFHCHPLNAAALSLCLDKIDKISASAAENKTNKFDNANSNSPTYIEKIYSHYPGTDIITPIDYESAYFFPKIYVFPVKFIDDIKKGGLKFKLNADDIFKENGVFMIKSHGSFSWGKTPIDALRWAMTLEASSEIILKLNSLLFP